jgi:hypothetical protein
MPVSSHVLSSVARGGTQWIAVGYLLFLQEQIKGIIIVSVRSGSPAHHGEATAVVDRRLWSGRGTSCSSGAGAL